MLQHAQHAGWILSHRRIGRGRFGNNGAGGNHSVASDRYTGMDDCDAANPDIASHITIAAVVTENIRLDMGGLPSTTGQRFSPSSLQAPARANAELPVSCVLELTASIFSRSIFKRSRPFSRAESGVFHDDAFNNIGNVFAVVAAFFETVERLGPGHDNDRILLLQIQAVNGIQI